MLMTMKKMVTPYKKSGVIKRKKNGTPKVDGTCSENAYGTERIQREYRPGICPLNRKDFRTDAQQGSAPANKGRATTSDTKRKQTPNEAGANARGGHGIGCGDGKGDGNLGFGTKRNVMGFTIRQLDDLLLDDLLFTI